MLASIERPQGDQFDDRPAIRAAKSTVTYSGAVIDIFSFCMRSAG
jgi:hypothetical protein